jgi:predicted metal-dependent peptidase
VSPIDEADRAAKRRALALWERDRAMLLIDQPFVAMLAMQLELVPVVDDRLQTACTDGERIYAHVNFLDQLDAEGRLFLLAHEVWHCALQHFERAAGRAQERWNVAIDHEVNHLLSEQGLSMPTGGVLFDRWRGLNAEEVYELIDDAICRSYLVFDEHGAGAPKSGDAVKLDPDYAPVWSPEVMRRWPQRVVAAAQQVQRQRGALPGSMGAVVERLLRPPLPWQELLRQFVTVTFGGQRAWLPPNRRHIHRGLYLPSQRGNNLDLAVAVDTSGSTSRDWPAFANELAALMHSFGRCTVRLMHCDVRITFDESFDEGQLDQLASHRFHGGGGTDFRPVFDRLSDGTPPRALVFFTDGEGRAPKRQPSYPVLWVLAPGGRAPSAWGQLAHLGEQRQPAQATGSR